MSGERECDFKGPAPEHCSIGFIFAVNEHIICHLCWYGIKETYTSIGVQCYSGSGECCICDRPMIWNKLFVLVTRDVSVIQNS